MMPRRLRIDLATPPEVAIRAAMGAVEKMPADVRLTNAGIKLGEALALVNDYVDEQSRDVDISPALAGYPRPVER
jgi:hypothetical protein